MERLRSSGARVCRSISSIDSKLKKKIHKSSVSAPSHSPEYRSISSSVGGQEFYRVEETDGDFLNVEVSSSDQSDVSNTCTCNFPVDSLDGVEGDFIFVEKKDGQGKTLQTTDHLESTDGHLSSIHPSINFETATTHTELSLVTELKDESAIFVEEDDHPISITNICSFNVNSDSSTTTNTLFGKEEGLFIIGDNSRLHPVLTDTVLDSIKSKFVSEGVLTHSTEPFCSVLRDTVTCTFTVSPQKVIHIHQYDSSSFCDTLQSQFFSLWKPVLHLTCSLKFKDHLNSPPHIYLANKVETKLDQLLQQANTVTYIQSESPSHVIVHLTDCEYFKSVTCFSDQTLTNEAIEKCKELIQSRLCKLFEDKTTLDVTPHITILDDYNLSSITAVIDDSGDQFSWKEFAFLVYLKTYSYRLNRPVMDFNEVSHVGMLFGITEINIDFVLKSFQSQQHILILPDHHLIVFNLQWLLSGFHKLQSLSLKKFPYLFNFEYSQQIDISSPDSILFHLLTHYRLLVEHQQSSHFFSTIFLPFHRKSNFCYNSKIGSLYLLTVLGVMPSGFFEKFIASIWQSSFLVLQKCQCRSTAIFDLKLDREALGDYFVKISNVKGYMKVSLASLHNLEVSYDTLSVVASRLITELKSHFKKFLPSDITDSLMMPYFDCCDPRCPQIKGRSHLTQVLTGSLVCQQNSYKTKLKDLDKSHSFWLKEQLHACVSEMKSDYMFPRVSRPPSLISDDLDMSNSLHFVISSGVTNHISKDNGHYTYDSVVSTFLQTHHVDIVDKLDTNCCHVLFQSHILIESQFCDSQSTESSNVVSAILSSVRAAGLRGIVGLVTAVKLDPDDTLYRTLCDDALYSTIKNCWLNDVLEQFCSC